MTLLRRPGLVAVLVWLVCTPLAFVVTAVSDLYPFHNRAWALSIASAFVAIGGLLALCWRRARDLLAGVAAGLLAAWVVLTLRITLDGTPFAFGGLSGDAGRASAAAVRYSVVWGSSDAFVAGVPPEAPPLFPWLIGRVSALVDVPAWQLVAGAEILGIALSVLVAFLLWLRLTTPWTALVIAALGLLVFGDPRKAHEALTLLAFVPWVLMTFSSPPRLHWLPGGLIGGLIALTYQAWYVFGALGLLALVWLGFRAGGRGYLRHVALVVAVAFVVASWHVVPYLWAVATRDSRLVSDLFTPVGVHGHMFPFLEPTPLGVIQLVGLAGLLLLRGRVWWAAPLLLLAASAFAYRVLAMVPYIPTGHTKFLHYADSLYSAVFAAAGVLVLVHVVPRLTLPPIPSGSAATAVAILLAWITYSYGQAWFPATGAPTSHYTAAAHREPLPQGGYPQFAPDLGRQPWFPVYRIRDAVSSVRGQGARPVALSPDERLFAYLPWPGYLGTARLASGSFALWDDRLAELRRLSSLGDPAAFATESADTRFGPIDVFVLRKGATSWVWQEGVTFQPAQFDPAVWAVFDDLPEGYVVVVRRP